MNDMLTLFISFVLTMGSIVLLRTGAISPTFSVTLMAIGVGMLLWYLSPKGKNRRR